MEFKVFVAFMAVLIIIALLAPRGSTVDRKRSKTQMADMKTDRTSLDDDVIQTSTGESGPGTGFR